MPDLFKEGKQHRASPFSPEQIAELEKPLDESRVQRRPDGLTYLPTYDVIETANRIFGYGGWQREIKRLEKIYEDSSEGTYSVGYLCECRIRIGEVIHEDVGFGSGVSQTDPARAYETALKGAVSDALKRCFRALGDQFGLSLYKKHEPEEAPAVPLATEAQLGRLRKELRSANLKESKLLDYINALMGTRYARLEELPLKVASRAIDKFVTERENFVEELKRSKG
ncbi:MAG: Rad52/Rad22 family DNA repair protein [Candidatus Bipolaricaulia bacterium]